MGVFLSINLVRNMIKGGNNMKEPYEHLEEYLPDYIECLEQAVERDKCNTCTYFECNIAKRNSYISATLNDLMITLKKMLL